MAVLEHDCRREVCNTPGACGDPRFIGGDGNTFYFHGRRDADFCVVFDHDLHINAHFIGKSGHNSMSRDFTWMQAIAVLFDGGHHLYVDARKTVTWDDTVEHLEIVGEHITLYGEPVHLPTDGANKCMSSLVPELSEDSRVHHYGITANDCITHLELTFKFEALTEDVHGVVWQTYRSDYLNRFNVKASMPTMGGDASFATSSMFAADCHVARYRVAHGRRTPSPPRRPPWATWGRYLSRRTSPHLLLSPPPPPVAVVGGGGAPPRAILAG
ncbi:uncharacterized protein LOC125546461 [Triticum urartu]|uniref:uncharacterized protein LOC125546461 n=1 Tax=Triticum urartu TaxID=4572 RepID=UPI002043C8E5|nr:uncharacterized protein LOC125546461 [Triticum urartu]